MLLLDGHTSHVYNKEFIKIMKDNNIIPFCLPSHTTHWLQPLDKSFFKSLKSHWNEFGLKFLRENGGRKPKKTEFFSIFSSAWLLSTTVETAQVGFRGTGLFPLNSKVIPEHAFTPSLTTEREYEPEQLQSNNINLEEESIQPSTSSSTPSSNVDAELNEAFLQIFNHECDRYDDNTVINILCELGIDPNISPTLDFDPYGNLVATPQVVIPQMTANLETEVIVETIESLLVDNEVEIDNNHVQSTDINNPFITFYQSAVDNATHLENMEPNESDNEDNQTCDETRKSNAMYTDHGYSKLEVQNSIRKKSFKDLCPTPKRERKQSTRKSIAKKLSYNLSSVEHSEFLFDKEQRIKESKKASNKTKKTVVTKKQCVMTHTKIVAKKRNHKKNPTKPPKEEKQSKAKKTVDICGVCHFEYGDKSDPKIKDKWFKCKICKKWCHDSCSKQKNPSKPSTCKGCPDTKN